VGIEQQCTADLSTGPFCVTRSNPTHQLADPTQPDTTNNGAYSLVETYFIYRTYLVLLVNQAPTYPRSLLIITHIKTVLLCHSKTSSSQKCLKCPQQQPSKPAQGPHHTRSVAGPNPTKSNLVHFTFKIWHLVATILTIFILPPHSRQTQTDKIQVTNTINTKLRPKA